MRNFIALSCALILQACGGPEAADVPKIDAPAVTEDSETSDAKTLPTQTKVDPKPAEIAEQKTAEIQEPHSTEDEAKDVAESKSTSSDPASAILVLDASGSMWGEVDGKHKIEIARDVIASTLENWDPGVHIGLMAYGHNRKGDCDDIEVLQQPSVLDATSFVKSVNDLNPKGKTPLTASVKQAAELLKYTEEKATVILVSDGEETCDLDPCAVGAELEKSGVDFTAHVIGFDVTEEQSVGLRCLADQTGGIYVTASNADDLNDAMEATAETVMGTTTELDLSEAILRAPATVPAGSMFDVEWTGPENIRDKIAVVDPETNKHFQRTYVSIAKNNISNLRAPEKIGVYRVEYQTEDGNVLGSTEIEVTPVTASLIFPESVPAGSRFLVEWKGPDNSGDYLRIINPGTGERDYSRYASKEHENKMTAPEEPGTYAVIYETRGGKVLAQEPLEVTPVEAMLDGPESVPAGAKFDVRWSGPANAGDRIAILDPETGKSVKGQFTSAGENNIAELIAPENPRQYELAYLTADRNTLVSVPIIVTSVTASLTLPSEPVPIGSTFDVEWTGPGNQGDRIRIRDMNDEKNFDNEFIDYNEGAAQPMRAPEKVGVYLVQYYSGGNTVLATETLTTQSVTATLIVPDRVLAGEKFEVDGDIPGYPQSQIMIVQPGTTKRIGRAEYGQTMLRGPIELRAPEEPGDFEVIYILDHGTVLARNSVRVSAR